jgi:hypothetical protein
VSNYEGKVVDKYNAAVKENGIEVLTFTAAQTAELDKLGASVRAQWIADNSEDFDAQELYDFTVALFNK